MSQQGAVAAKKETASGAALARDGHQQMIIPFYPVPGSTVSGVLGSVMGNPVQKRHGHTAVKGYKND